MNGMLRFKEDGHLDPALTDPATRTLHADTFLGSWVNTNRKTQGIEGINISLAEDVLWVSASGVGANDPIQWPATRAKVLANLEEEAGQRAVALAVTFEFGFMKAETYLRINKGVLVIVLFNTFLDGSGRSNYVNREFFYRQE